MPCGTPGDHQTEPLGDDLAHSCCHRTTVSEDCRLSARLLPIIGRQAHDFARRCIIGRARPANVEALGTSDLIKQTFPQLKDVKSIYAGPATFLLTLSRPA